jgi:hypothetical protein
MSRRAVGKAPASLAVQRQGLGLVVPADDEGLSTTAQRLRLQGAYFSPTNNLTSDRTAGSVIGKRALRKIAPSPDLCESDA